MLLHQSIRKMQSTEVLEVIASDPTTLRDIPDFCQHLGHTLLLSGLLIGDTSESTAEQHYRFLIQKK